MKREAKMPKIAKGEENEVHLLFGVFVLRRGIRYDAKKFTAMVSNCLPCHSAFYQVRHSGEKSPPPHFSLAPSTLSGSKIFARACGARVLKCFSCCLGPELRF